MIQASPAFYFLAALLVLLLPVDWLCAAVLAALLHEISHILVVLLWGGKLRRVSLGAAGCVIETGPLAPWQEFVSILAGPLGSFSLLFFCRFFPRLAVCGCIHGVYNLMPVLPLDGGRLLRCIFHQCRFSKSELIMKWIADLCCIFLSIFGFWACFFRKMGVGSLIFGMILVLRLGYQKNSLQTAGNQGTIEVTFFKR